MRIALVGASGRLGRSILKGGVVGSGRSRAREPFGADRGLCRVAGASMGAAVEKAVEATICDASGLLRGRGGSADEVVEDFIRYRGTTAEALTAARSAGFDHAVSRALRAGIAKARKPRA